MLIRQLHGKTSADCQSDHAGSPLRGCLAAGWSYPFQGSTMQAGIRPSSYDAGSR